MTKIVYCNSEIKKIHYSGYTITKVYACGGELVYSASTSDLFLSNRYNSGGTIIYDRMTCEENEQYHWNNTVSCELIKQFNSGSSICHEENTNVHILDSIMGDCVTTVEYHAYDGCTNLSAVTFGNNVEIIDSQAFKGCTSLKKAIIKDKVTSIGFAAFSGCTGLQEVVISSAITSIGSEAFYRCWGVGSIISGKGITVKATTPPTLGTDVFANATTGGNFKIYVPANSVNTYKTASGWSEYAQYIEAIP